MLENGTRAPQFVLPDMAGTSRQLADVLDAGPVVLAFFKTGCPTCKMAFPYLERLRQAYPSDRWQLWGISQDSAGTSQSFADTTGATFPILIDGDGFPVSQQYDPPATPTIFFVDRDGTIRSGHYGLSKSDLNALAEQVAAVLDEKPVVIAPPDDGNPDFKPG